MQAIKRDDMRFLSSLREDYTLMFIDTLKAIDCGDIILADNQPPIAAQVVDRSIEFTGKKIPNVHQLFALAERYLETYPAAYTFERLGSSG